MDFKLLARSRAPLAFSLSVFAQMILHNVWIVLQMPLFIGSYGIQGRAIVVVEILFAVWNSVNDPLFGWWVRGQTTPPLVLRARAMKYGGIGLALTFLIPFWSFSNVGLHFFVALCLYDGFLTWVSVSRQALIADSTAGQPLVRNRCVTMGAFASIVASLSLIPCYFKWSSGDLAGLRPIVLCLSAISILAFVCSSHLIQSLADAHGSPSLSQSSHTDAKPWPFARQLLKNSNFRVFSAFSFLQVFNCHSVSVFFLMELHTLCENAGALAQSLVLVVAFVAPHASTMLLAPMLDSRGPYRVVQWLLLFKLVLSALAWSGGDGSWAVIIVFLLLNRIGTEGTCRILDLFVADIIDEDAVEQRRRRRLAAPIYGAVSLISKPGQSIAPLFGFWWLKTFKGSALFSLMVIVPFVVAGLQLLLWKLYTLRGIALNRVREAVTSSDLDMKLCDSSILNV